MHECDLRFGIVVWRACEFQTRTIDVTHQRQNQARSTLRGPRGAAARVVLDGTVPATQFMPVTVTAMYSYSHL